MRKITSNSPDDMPIDVLKVQFALMTLAIPILMRQLGLEHFTYDHRKDQAGRPADEPGLTISYGPDATGNMIATFTRAFEGERR